MQCRSECENYVLIWERCIHEAGTNVETKEALANMRQDVVCYCYIRRLNAGFPFFLKLCQSTDPSKSRRLQWDFFIRVML
jgi:hypothetical protein